MFKLCELRCGLHLYFRKLSSIASAPHTAHVFAWCYGEVTIHMFSRDENATLCGNIGYLAQYFIMSLNGIIVHK
jgi:hypothetical protein